MRKVAGINSDIRRIADEVGEGLYGELDYMREARQAQLFATAHAHLPYVKVAKVIEELTSSKYEVYCGFLGLELVGLSGKRN